MDTISHDVNLVTWHIHYLFFCNLIVIWLFIKLVILNLENLIQKLFFWRMFSKKINRKLLKRSSTLNYFLSHLNKISHKRINTPYSTLRDAYLWITPLFTCNLHKRNIKIFFISIHRTLFFWKKLKFETFNGSTNNVISIETTKAPC